ncbi:hypothetical protein NADFUDRAFT_48921 [Nadsonia fulvescens var. elongata DSM 6958]|uniref:Meiotic sister chromatid recombination protein 1 n=1 Tax=Nadsonia fulvescens var. elongata DSM 6958 TaxID=857566 RepID=A0A1E3PS66_9ASCO|nr:hypothetical protein NADFUDRAFT_48921 [Nadsonia fulvescens var. elongata DSM 6958]
MKVFRNYATLIYLCTLGLGAQASLQNQNALRDWSVDEIRQVLVVYNIPLPQEETHHSLLDTAHSHWDSIVEQSQLTADQIMANLDQFKSSIKSKANEKWSGIKNKAHKHVGAIQDTGSDYASQGYDAAAEKAAEGYNVASKNAAEGYRAASSYAAEGYETGKDYATQGYDIAAEKAAEGYGVAKEKAAESYDVVKEKAAEGVDVGKEKAAQGYEVVKEKAAEGIDVASEKAAHGYEAASSYAAEGYEAGKDYAAQGYDIAAEKAAEGYEIAKEKAAEGLDSAKDQAATGFGAVKGKVAQGYEAIKEQAAQGYHDAQVKSDKTAKNVADAAANAANAANEASKSASSAANAAANTAKGAANAAADTAKGAYSQSKTEASGILGRLRQGIQYVFSTDRNGNSASGDIAAWAFSTWSDSQLKDFLRKHNIAFAQEATTIDLRQIARDNYDQIKDSMASAKDSVSDWLYESWSDADLKSWLKTRGVDFPESANRQELIASVRQTSENLSDKLTRFKQSLYPSLEDDKENIFDKSGEIKDSAFDSWSVANLKSFAEAHGIRLPKGQASNNREELLAVVRNYKHSLKDDVSDFIAQSKQRASPIMDKIAQSPRQIFDSTAKLWSEPRLRDFLVSRGVAVPESASRDELINIANENFEAAQSKAWSFGSWSTDSLKKWLQDKGQDLSDDRQELVNKAHAYVDDARSTVNKAGSKVSDAGSKVADAGTYVKDKLNEFYQSGKDSMNSWSDKDLKEYLTSYGVASPIEWTREDLLKAAQQQQVYFHEGFTPVVVVDSTPSTGGYLGNFFNYFKKQSTPVQTSYIRKDEL